MSGGWVARTQSAPSSATPMGNATGESEYQSIVVTFRLCRTVTRNRSPLSGGNRTVARATAFSAGLSVIDGTSTSRA